MNATGGTCTLPVCYVLHFEPFWLSRLLNRFRLWSVERWLHNCRFRCSLWNFCLFGNDFQAIQSYDVSPKARHHIRNFIIALYTNQCRTTLGSTFRILYQSTLQKQGKPHTHKPDGLTTYRLRPHQSSRKTNSDTYKVSNMKNDCINSAKESMCLWHFNKKKLSILVMNSLFFFALLDAQLGYPCLH